VKRRPIQLLSPVWNTDESEEVLLSLAEEISHLGISKVIPKNNRSSIRLAFIELSESRQFDDSSAANKKFVSMGVEVKLFKNRVSRSTLRNFLSESEQAILGLGQDTIGTAREACTIIAAIELDLTDNPIIWFLDDDLQFRQLGTNQNGELELGHHQNLFDDVWSFHERHPSVSVSLGGVTGSPPLPASSSLLCNMRDLLASVNHESVIESDSNRWDIPDYYYDLSEHPERKDTIFPNPNLGKSIDTTDAVLCHGSLFRPIVLTEKGMGKSESTRMVRGGNCLIYDLRAFVANPYPTLELRGTRSRRGDTLWSCLNTFLDDKQILSHNMMLHHGRDSISWDEQQQDRFITRMLTDLYGVAFYRTIASLFDKGEFTDSDDFLRLAPVLHLAIESRAERHGEMLLEAEATAIQIGEISSDHNSLSVEVSNICRLAREALADVPSEDELHVALVDCWSRLTLWREKIGPRLLEIIRHYHS
jgi:hypothetical protein